MNNLEQSSTYELTGDTYIDDLIKRLSSLEARVKLGWYGATYTYECLEIAKKELKLELSSIVDDIIRHNEWLNKNANDCVPFENIIEMYTNFEKQSDPRVMAPFIVKMRSLIERKLGKYRDEKNFGVAQFSEEQRKRMWQSVCYDNGAKGKIAVRKF